MNSFKTFNKKRSEKMFCFDDVDPLHCTRIKMNVN